MGKIVCATCKNEKDSFCTTKKIGIHLNKRRDCDKYLMEEAKIKPKHLLQTVKVPYAEKEALKQQYKQALKQHREAAKLGVSVPTDPSHPLTGDLSRFITSTAAKE